MIMTLNKELEFFLSKFSHELRNPLTSVYSTIQLLEMQHPEVKDFKHWSGLTQDVEYMIALLAELSDLTKSERLQNSVFSFRTLMEHVSLSFAASIVDSDVEYTSKIDPNLPNISGDNTKLQEVFRNLLKNAYDAAAPNHSIYLEATTKDDHVVVTISDTGCGIDKDQLPTIFEPFVTYKKDGTGLGLAICDHIVKAHGGTITVDSTLGVGTRFCITLPI